MADIVVYVDTPSEVCKARRLGRSERTTAETEELSTYIDRFVWQSHENYCLPSLIGIEGMITVDGTSPIDDIVSYIVTLVQEQRRASD